MRITWYVRREKQETGKREDKWISGSMEKRRAGDFFAFSPFIRYPFILIVVLVTEN
jgi:hypothetical protein